MKNNKRKFILFINTAVRGEISISLFGEGRFFHARANGNSDKLLVLVDRVFKKNKIKPAELSGIAVVSGPGSFTAVRQGVVAANTLGFFLGIPVAGVRLDEFGEENFIEIISKKLEGARAGELVRPFYGGEPNITKPKG